MQVSRVKPFYFLFALLLLLSVNSALADEGGLYDSVPSTTLEATVAVDWVQMAYDRIMVERISAPAASRIYAYTAITIYETMLPGAGDNTSLIGQVADLNDLPWPPEDAIYDFPTAVNAAASSVLTGLFEGASEETLAAISELRQQYIESRTEEVDAEVVERSIIFGDMMAASLLEWIYEDAFAWRETEYTIPEDDPSTWVTTSDTMVAVEPFWGTIRPLVLADADECAILPDVPFSTEEDSVFYAQAVEVMEITLNMTDEQREIAEFWVDTPGLSGTPAGHWMLIGTALIEQFEFTLSRAAELYSMIGIAAMDSFISCWSLKYQVPQLRPESYINQYINPRWRPHIASPGFPEYPSGHSTVSGAVATVLTSYFGGPVAFTQTNITPDGDLVTRSFTSFEAAAYEAAISRVYGGIHFRSAVENGLAMGECVGEHVVEAIRLNPIRQGE